MAADRKRGRPKGTGINDHEMLLKIAQIMVANPAKKRTTAIKEVGITNASVVRRLRDKYQAEEAQLLAEVHAANAVTAPAQTTASTKSRKPAVNGHAAAQVAAPVAKTETAAPAVTKKGKAATGQAATTATAAAAAAPVTTHVHVEPISAAPQAAAQPAPAAAATAQTKASNPAQTTKPAVDPLAALFEGLNIETLVTQFIGHALGLSAAEIKNSPIPALIRQQAQLADLVLPLLASQFLGQKSNSKAA